MSTILTVDRNTFLLRVWRMNKGKYYRTHRLPIAVGAVGYTTPSGMYFVEAKTRTPAWKAPDEEWVSEELRGKTFKFGTEENPFAGGFISLSGGEGIGIHGVKFDPKLGTRASHGCIRLATEAFLKIYDKVPIYTPVYIH